MCSFCRKTHVHKIARSRGGGVILGLGGGGGKSADFIFMGREDFSDRLEPILRTLPLRLRLLVYRRRTVVTVFV